MRIIQSDGPGYDLSFDLVSMSLLDLHFEVIIKYGRHFYILLDGSLDGSLWMDSGTSTVPRGSNVGN